MRRFQQLQNCSHQQVPAQVVWTCLAWSRLNTTIDVFFHCVKNDLPSSLSAYLQYLLKLTPILLSDFAWSVRWATQHAYSNYVFHILKEFTPWQTELNNDQWPQVEVEYILLLTKSSTCDCSNSNHSSIEKPCGKPNAQTIPNKSPFRKDPDLHGKIPMLSGARRFSLENPHPLKSSWKIMKNHQFPHGFPMKNPWFPQEAEGSWPSSREKRRPYLESSHWRCLPYLWSM